MKRNKYALDAHSSLLALRSGVANQVHLIDLYVLAELCQKLTEEPHIIAHCGSVRRLCNEIHDAEYQCSELRYAAMEASANLLLNWFEKQSNPVIARTATNMVRKLAA
jgi:hypothetical protein